MLFGYIFFGEVLGPLPLAGASIVGAGLFILIREQQLRRSRPARP